MRKTVLDASAILAALFREPGAGVVETHYEAGIVSSVNLSEVAAKLSDRGMPSIEARELLSGLGLGVRPFDERLAYMAGALRDATRSKACRSAIEPASHSALQKAFPSSPWTGNGPTSRKRWVSRSPLRDEHPMRGERSAVST